MLKKLFCTTFIMLSLTSATKATIVEFQTSQGAIQVNLFDQTTPNTVANFLNYINEQHYTNSLVHRVATNFVVQGGGYSFEGTWPLTRLVTNAPVINEPIYSNVKGTIAMAKLSNSVNSATDQWFFNLANNASNLDLQNGGFTVFGQVIGDGMAVLEKIAQLRLCNAGTLEGIPMVVDDGQQCADLTSPGIENFVVINNIIIVDSAEVTDDNLNPVKNTSLTPITDPTSPTTDSSSGGAFTFYSLLGLILFSIRKRFFRTNR